MASRDINDLHPPLAKRFRWLKENVHFENELKLACTYRSKQEQLKLWELYKNHNGPVAAPPGQSLHNYKKAYAFDVFFQTPEGTADYSWHQFEKLAKEAKKLGLEWGGDWKGKRDGPHFQMPMTWRDAIDGNIPKLPPVPTNDNLKKILNSLSFQLRNMLSNLMMRGS